MISLLEFENYIQNAINRLDAEYEFVTALSDVFGGDTDIYFYKFAVNHDETIQWITDTMHDHDGLIAEWFWESDRCSTELQDIYTTLLEQEVLDEI